jgi:hypothetical protein
VNTTATTTPATLLFLLTPPWFDDGSRIVSRSEIASATALA